MREASDTLVVIHASREFRTFHRRPLIEALAGALPESWAVLCVNRPLTADSLVRHRHFRLREAWHERRPQQIGPKLFLFRPVLAAHELVADRVPGLAEANRALLRRQLKRAVHSVSGDEPQAISWICDPVRRWVWGLLPQERRVYECYDPYGLNPDGTSRPRVQRRERETLAAAEVTFVTAEGLAARHRTLAKRLVFLSNGVPASFLAAPATNTPAPLLRTRPRIGYVGSEYPFLAYDVLNRVCRDHPEWDFVFAGPFAHHAQSDRLRECPNVSFTGYLPHSAVPAFLKQLEVALIPFDTNAYVKLTNPVKTYEYMAAGVPIVASDLPELHRFRNLIRFAENTPEAFAHAIAETLAANREELRARLVEAARDYTWEHLCRTVVVPELVRLTQQQETVGRNP